MAQQPDSARLPLTPRLAGPWSGPGIIRRWLELIEDTLGQHRKSQRILMHGSWSMLSTAQAIKFFFDIPPPAQGIEFKTEAKNIIDTADEFVPVQGQYTALLCQDPSEACRARTPQRPTVPGPFSA